VVGLNARVEPSRPPTATGPLAAPLDDLLDSFAQALDRRASLAWGQRERAAAAFEVAKSDQASRGRDPFAVGLSTLARRFDLDRTDTALLVIAAAAGADPSLRLLAGLLCGNEQGEPTVALGWELVGLPTMSAESVLRMSARGALRRFGLLALEGGGPLHALRMRVPHRVVAHLLGEDTPPARLVPYLVKPAPIDGPEASLIAAALRDGQPLIWVQNPPAGAGTAVAAGACREIGAVCLQADIARSPHIRDGGTRAEAAGADRSDPAAVRTLVADLVLEAGLTGAVLILAGAENAAPAGDILSTAPLPVVAVSTAPWDRSWTTVAPVAVTAPRLGIEQRAALWAPLFDGHPPDREIYSLRLSPEEIDTVGRLARIQADVEGEPTVSKIQIRHAVRRLNRRRTGRSTPPAAVATLEDLVLSDHAAAEFRRLLGWVRHRDDVLSQRILAGKGGKGSGICALFSGNPGTGKTLAAHIVADTLGMDLYTIELATMVDKYIGETEKNLEQAFTEAESLNAVLFFDEADALFGSRSEVRDAHDRYANQEVAYLLQRMEQFDGITVLATNLRGNLDAAFARRLHFVITFTDPDAATRRRLWCSHLEQLAAVDAADPVDTDSLANDLEITGGDIRNIVLAAAYAAAEDAAPVGMRHVVPAVAREFAKLGRRVPARDYLKHSHTGSSLPVPTVGTGHRQHRTQTEVRT
jgi:hypothetical protein